MAQVLMDIDRELDEIGYEWLGDTHPRLLQAIEREVARGADPQHIRRRVLDRTDRRELALRCEQAARHARHEYDIATSREKMDAMMKQVRRESCTPAGRGSEIGG